EVGNILDTIITRERTLLLELWENAAGIRTAKVEAHLLSVAVCYIRMYDEPTAPATVGDPFYLRRALSNLERVARVPASISAGAATATYTRRDGTTGASSMLWPWMTPSSTERIRLVTKDDLAAVDMTRTANRKLWECTLNFKCLE